MLNPTLKCNADRNLAIVHKSLLRFSKGDPCRKDSISLTWKMKWVLLGGNPWSESNTYKWINSFLDRKDSS